MRTLLSRSATVAAAAGALALAGACKEATSVNDLNNLPASTIASGLTPTTFQLLTTGLVNQDRANFSFGYIIFTETMARDVVNLDPSESRYVTELLGGPIDPGGFAGSGNFLGYYNAIATGNTILSKLPGLQQNYAFTTQDIAATTGFIQTYKALELYRVFATRGPNGVPADAAAAVTDTVLPPLLCQTSALARISALLDTAYTSLQAAGPNGTFPFVLPSGFSSNGSFSTPATFAQFNRGLKAKVEVYRGILAQNGDVASTAGTPYFTNALAAFNSSFLNVAGDLSAGVYYSFSAAPNEQLNPIAATTVYLNQQVGDSVLPGDLRASKIVKLSKPRTLNRVTTNYTSTLSNPSTQTAVSIPLLTNGELVLLRAQAQLGLGNLAGATADANVVHTSKAVTSPQIGGGLPAYAAFTSAAVARDSILYDKRYALLLTGAQRLVDLRSYNLLNAQHFKQEIATDIFNAAAPIPKQEVDARNGNLTLTCNQ